jgi:hypothetical protein
MRYKKKGSPEAEADRKRELRRQWNQCGARAMADKFEQVKDGGPVPGECRSVLMPNDGHLSDKTRAGLEKKEEKK